MIYEENYKDLANAIIIQAVQDYKDTANRIIFNKINLNQVNQTALDTLDDLYDFFESDWFKKLTNINSEYILKKIKFQLIKKWKNKKEYKIPIIKIYKCFNTLAITYGL